MFKLSSNYAYYLNMKCLFDISIIVATTILKILAYNSNYLSYRNCMSQTRSDYIAEKGAAHVAVIYRTFILEKAMVN